MEGMDLGGQAEKAVRPHEMPEVVRRRADKLADYCRAYKAREIARDTFDTNAAGRLEDRKAKYAERDPATIEADKRNKLRRNNITPVLGGFELLIDAIEKTHDAGPLSTKVQSLSKELPDLHMFSDEVYESMSFEEKRALAERMDKIADSFLEALSTEAGAEEEKAGT